MTEAGETCWIDTWLVAPSRKHRAAVIDTATGNVLFQTESLAEEADAVMVAAGWVEEQARLLVHRPAEASRRRMRRSSIWAKKEPAAAPKSP